MALRKIFALGIAAFAISAGAVVVLAPAATGSHGGAVAAAAQPGATMVEYA
jgi:hypothetical protein